MRNRRRHQGVLLCAAALAPFALAACGDDEEDFDPIPARNAAALETQLDQVADRVDRGICGSARSQVDELRDKVAALPDGIDPDLREALDDGVDRLADLVESDENCRPEEDEDETDTQTTETEPPEEEPEEEEEVPEEEQPPPETQTQPPPEPEPEPEPGGTPAPEEDPGAVITPRGNGRGR